MIKLIKLLLSIMIAFSAGLIGNIATVSNIPTWYAELAKPSFNPPNWLFGPVWTLLYLLMGISLYLVWVAKYKKPKTKAFIIFGLQLALNTLWTLVFFGLHWLDFSVLIILALIVSIIATMCLFRPISKTASWLLMPYLAWVSFATILNICVTILN